MPHLNPTGTDWVNAAFIVHPNQPKVLLVHHKKLNGWYPVGGHIELDTVDRDPDDALVREVKEETGLSLWRDDGKTDPDTLYNAYVWQRRRHDRLRSRHRALSTMRNNGARLHWVPWAVETHLFSPLPGHKHLALIYLIWALAAEVRLEESAHNEIRWLSRRDLDGLPPSSITDTVRMFALEAISSRFQ